MNEKIKLNLDFYTWEEIKKIFFNKKFQNVILFSQPRSGSTFVSNILSKELNYPENFFPEEFFINQHFIYLKYFLKKHNNFFINRGNAKYEDMKKLINYVKDEVMSKTGIKLDLEIILVE